MIIRTDGDQLLLMRQPDHAELAARVMAAWRADGLSASPARESILFATREHDSGWEEPDRSPIVDAGSGRLLDFINAPDNVRQGVWPRAVARLDADPYAAALVAEHALNIYERYREIAAWDPFFAGIEAARDRALDACRDIGRGRRRAADREAAPTLADVQRDYFFVRAGDLISLAFCTGWREPQRFGQYLLQPTGNGLTITPDPFDGAVVELQVPARQLPNRRYLSADDARRAFEAAPGRVVSGVAAGPHA